ncbi:MAG: 2-oxoacid:ferredoxin oxidoreductase subunit beta [Cyclobacteriaceae bacterium]
MATTAIAGNGTNKLTAKDFATDQDVRWCPGCGDYSILKQVQTVMAETGKSPEDIVFISGIGCAARFPYYMETYGMHSIHGRALAIAAGLKSVRKELSVWVVSGDGDCLSIGGNHLIHALRRNFNLNLLLFNNEIYGLTKGQYSPTSPSGKVTGSTPYGSLDAPFNPLSLSLGAGGSFIARSMDRDPIHLRATLHKANEHQGTSLLEIYQNCNVFNDGAFFTYTDKATKVQSTIFLEHGEPLVFGDDKSKGIKLDGFTPVIVDLKDAGKDDLWIHNENDKIKANILTGFFEHYQDENTLPRPFGVIYKEDRSRYEDLMNAQVEDVISSKGKGDLDLLLKGTTSWKIE